MTPPPVFWVGWSALARRRGRIETEPDRKRPVRRKPKPEPLPELVRVPAYKEGRVLRPGEVAELFAVTTRTVRRWADAGMLPVFRTSAGNGASGGGMSVGLLSRPAAPQVPHLAKRLGKLCEDL
jgi:hypothetical protein